MNRDVTRNFINNLGVPQTLSPGIVTLSNNAIPIIDISSFKNKQTIFLGNNSVQNTTGTKTILTASSTLDTYITGIFLSIAKDATSDLGTGICSISTTINGLAVTLLGIATITLNAQNQSIFVQLNAPLKIDKGAVINLGGTSNSFTVGNCIRSAHIFGFTDTSNVNNN